LKIANKKYVRLIICRLKISIGEKYTFSPKSDAFNAFSACHYLGKTLSTPSTKAEFDQIYRNYSIYLLTLNFCGVYNSINRKLELIGLERGVPGHQWRFEVVLEAQSGGSSSSDFPVESTFLCKLFSTSHGLPANRHLILKQ